MEEQKSFKKRIKEIVMYNAKIYKEYYVDYEYLLCSKAFVRKSYYIISAHEDNYLHLTGLNTKLSAKEFFEKCYNGTLDEADFDFIKDGQSEKEVKGSVRRKINVLPHVMNMFGEETMVEEDFVKNRIRCMLATGNEKATLGFVVAGKAKPMTLLKGNELNASKARTVELALRRKVGMDKFEELLVGNAEILKIYKGIIGDIISETLWSELE